MKLSRLIEPPFIPGSPLSAHTAGAESLRPTLPRSLFQGRVFGDAALVRDKDAADPDGPSSRVSVVEKQQI